MAECEYGGVDFCRTNGKDEPVTLIVNGKIADADEGSDTLLLEGERIRYAGSLHSLPSGWAARADVRIDAAGGWLVPGFIDVHVHGGNGCSFMDTDIRSFETVMRFHARHGTTSLLATTLSSTKQRLDAALETAWRCHQGAQSYSRLLGVHLEGPFLSRKWPGAQNPAYLIPPQSGWIDDWNRRYPGLIRMVSLAPELEGATELIRTLASAGIVPSCAHTDASYEQIRLAMEDGLRHAAHLFNAMTGLHHRQPGTVGAVLTEPALSAEVIADGHHVHPACLKLLADVKRQNNLLLVTDAVPAAGLADGNYRISELDVCVREGVARLAEGGALAGSTLTMISAFRFMVQQVGISVPEASRLASANASRLLGLDDRLGRLLPGYLADVLLLSDQLEIHRTWVGGTELSFEDDEGLRVQSV